MRQEPLVELLLTDRSGWEGDEELASEIAHGLPPAALWRQAEARLLAQRVAELVESGSVRAGEVVVLLRAAATSRSTSGRCSCAACARWRRSVASGRTSRSAICWRTCARSPIRSMSRRCTGRSPRHWLASRATAWRCSRGPPAQAGRGVWGDVQGPQEEGLLDELAERDRGALRAFCSRLQSERPRLPRRTLSELIERAIDSSGYREHVLGLEWGERRLANVHKLLRLARRFEASEGRDLRGFLDHAARLQETTGGRESDAPVEGVEPDAVRLMSIHAAKGLEFPVVCVADLGRAPNVRQPEVLVDGERLGLSLVRLDGAKAVPALDYEQLAEERRQAESEEEDRILYVAMTRARERLLLSGAVEFERWPEQRQGATMISWLGPALAAEVPALASAGSPPVHDLAVGGGPCACG